MPLPPNYVNDARRDALEARVTAIETGGGGGGLVVTGSKAAGKIPKVQGDGNTVAWADDTDTTGLIVTGTKAAGLIPKVDVDGTTVVWAADASSGGGGSSFSRGQRTKYVAAAGEPDAALCDYQCDGTDDHVQINAALAAVATETIGRGTNGGKVVLVGRRFTIGGAILVPTQAHLTSEYGEQATQVRCAASYQPGNAGGMIQLATVDTQYVTVDHLTIDGQGNQVSGLYINNATAQEYDAYHKFSDLYIWNCGGNANPGIGDGIALINNTGGRLRGNHVRNVRVINSGRYGVLSNCPDSFYDMVDVGSAGSHGFYIAHSNNRFTNCKAWYSDGSGFYFTGGRDNQLSACESQDNAQHGYHIASAKNTLSSCLADSNNYTPGTGATGSFHGFNIVSNGTTLVGCVASEKSEHTATQMYGFNVSGAPKIAVYACMAFGNTAGPTNGTPAAGSIWSGGVVSY